MRSVALIVNSLVMINSKSSKIIVIFITSLLRLGAISSIICVLLFLFQKSYFR